MTIDSSCHSVNPSNSTIKVYPRDAKLWDSDSMWTFQIQNGLQMDFFVCTKTKEVLLISRNPANQLSLSHYLPQGFSTIQTVGKISPDFRWPLRVTTPLVLSVWQLC